MIGSTEDQVFALLDEMRNEGSHNMLHGPAFLMQEFDMDRQEAWEWFKKWQKYLEGDS